MSDIVLKRSRSGKPCSKCGATLSRYWDKRCCYDCHLKVHRAWSRANRDKRNAAKRRYRQKNPYDGSPTQNKIRTHRRRARLASAPGRGLTTLEWAAIQVKQRGRCFDCGERKRLTIGHLVPIVLGGAHDPVNIVAQCSVCNSRQGARVHPAAV